MTLVKKSRNTREKYELNLPMLRKMLNFAS